MLKGVSQQLPVSVHFSLLSPPIFVQYKAPRYISCKLKSQHKKTTEPVYIMSVTRISSYLYTPILPLVVFEEPALGLHTVFPHNRPYLDFPRRRRKSWGFSVGWDRLILEFTHVYPPVTMISNSGTAVLVLEWDFWVPKDILQKGIYGALDDSNNFKSLNHTSLSDGFFQKWAMGPSDNHDLGVFGIPSLGSKIWIIEFTRGASKFEHPTCSWNHSHGI